MITVNAAECFFCKDIFYARCKEENCTKCSCTYYNWVYYDGEIVHYSQNVVCCKPLTLVLDIESHDVLTKDFKDKTDKYGRLKKGTWKSKF